MIKWWNGLRSSDDINNLIWYLLEEKQKYENGYTHYFNTGGAASSLLNKNISTFEDFGKEMNSLQSTLERRNSNFEQCYSANPFTVPQDLSDILQKIKTL